MCRRAAVAVALALAVCVLAPASASALNPVNGACTIIGAPIPGGSSLCKGIANPGHIVSVVKKVAGIAGKLVTGHPGAALGAAAGAVAGIGLGAIVSWVLGGAGFALHETAILIGKTTTPQLSEPWFSSTYLHMAAIATLLTLPFLFAAAVQAMMRSDLAMLARAALGYLPLAMLAIAIAAPLTTLLLAASDGLSNGIEQAAGGAGAGFLTKTSLDLGGLSGVAGSPFVAFLVGFFVAAGALVLWLELLLREVAVYVIVLMLPLVFAAFVWPARRIWAIRSVEALVALIFAKIAIVAVLALGAGALSHAAASSSMVSLLAGVALVTLGLFAPWALVKLMPLGELAAATSGPLRGHVTAGAREAASIAGPWSGEGSDLISRLRHLTMPAGDSPPADIADARTPERSQGVTGGDTTDPLRGTADTPGGQEGPGAPGGTGSPGASGEPASPAAPASPGAPSSPAAPGVPSEPASPGAPGAPAAPGAPPPPPEQQQERQRPTLMLGPESCAPPAEAPPAEAPPPDDDPRPPAQEPEDGPL